MFDSFLQFSNSPEILENILASFFLILFLLLFRWFSVNRIRGWNIRSPELRLRWMVQIRNWSFLLLVAGLIIIWATEIRSLALSIAALAVAFAISGKELIMCLVGSFFKASSQSFQLGDRINISGLRGDVIDQNLIATKLLEVGPPPNGMQYTGKTVSIPNSIFLVTPVVNETLSQQVCLHAFQVDLNRELDSNWHEAEAVLLKAAGRVCQAYLPEAKLAMDKLARQSALDAPSVEPRVSVEFLSNKDIRFVVRVACLPNNRYKVEQAILRSFQRRFFKSDIKLTSVS